MWPSDCELCGAVRCDWLIETKRAGGFRVRVRVCEFKVKCLAGGEMVVHAVLIINKAGGLIFQLDLHNGHPKLTTNEYLVLAGTFHG